MQGPRQTLRSRSDPRGRFCWGWGGTLGSAFCGAAMSTSGSAPAACGAAGARWGCRPALRVTSAVKAARELRLNMRQIIRSKGEDLMNGASPPARQGERAPGRS